MFKNSIRLRFTAIFIVLAVIPVIFVGAILGWRTFNREQEQAIQLQEQLAERVAIEVQNTIRGLERELQLLIELENIHELSPEELVQVLSRLRFFESNFDELFILDASGQEIAQSSRFRIGTDELPNRAEADLFTIPVATGNTYYSPVRIDQNTGEPLMTMAIAFSNPRTQELAGVIAASARIKNLRTIIEQINLDVNDDVYIVDADERIIAHRNLGIVLSDTRVELDEGSQNLIGLQSEDVVIVSNEIPLGNQKFTVVVENAISDIQENAINTIIILGGVIIIVVLIAMILGIASIRQIIRPISELVEVAQAIEAGNLDQQVMINRQDELGILSNSFNSMTQRLRLNIENLEERVQDRTQDLENIMDNLRQANNQLVVAKHEADDANRLKSEFLATMSHELRTPLNAIIGYTQIIMEGMTGEINDMQHDQLDRVFVNSMNLLDLINQILDLAKIEAGRMEIIETEFDIQDIVEEVQYQMQNLADQKNLELITSISPDVPPTLIADEGHIRQIMINLISNAVKFTDSGSISLTIDAPSKQNKWTIQVIDTGMGIPPHMLDSIFEEFRQVDGSSKRKHGGSGLGLSIVQRLTNLMRGTIHVESQIGKGSKFLITFPLKTTEDTLDSVKV